MSTHELRLGCAFLTRQVAAKYDLYAMAGYGKVENMAEKIEQINRVLPPRWGHLQCKLKVKFRKAAARVVGLSNDILCIV